MDEAVGFGIHLQYCECCDLIQFQWLHETLVEDELVAPDLELSWKMASVDPFQALRELCHDSGRHMVV